MPELTPERIRFILMAVIGMILSSAVHEWAHAFTAYKLGDDTAARQGRMTLNPLAHIDPIGTIVMPAVGAMMGFIFGYAKPVPFNPAKFTRKIPMNKGTMLVALAGPMSNLILAILCAAILKIILVATSPDIYQTSDFAHMVGALLFTGIWLNVILFIFNFLPVYPLDGSKILEGVLPRRYHHILEFMQRNSMLIMLLIFLVGFRLLARPMLALTGLILDMFQLSGVPIY